MELESEIPTLENSKGKMAQFHQQINYKGKNGEWGFSTKRDLKDITKDCAHFEDLTCINNKKIMRYIRQWGNFG
jgi:hypothetical protein